MGSGVESSDLSGDGSSVLDHGSGLESSDRATGSAASSTVRLWIGLFSLSAPKYSFPSISDKGGVIGTSAIVTVVLVGFLGSGSLEKSCLCISPTPDTSLGSSIESMATFRRPRLRRILRNRKNDTIRVAIRIMAMAIPVMAPVPMPWEPLPVVLIIDALLEVGFAAVAPVVSVVVEEMATIWLGVRESNFACEIEKLDLS